MDCPLINGRLTALSLLVVLLASFSHSSTATYSKHNCEFHSANYSLEWALESLGRNLVFVLKAAVPQGVDTFWTGIGFGDRSRDPLLDFIGVFVSSGRAGVVDGHISSATGRMETDALSDNVQSIALEMTGKEVKAKFARPLVSQDVEQDGHLPDKDCFTFNMPLQAVVPSTLKGQSNFLGALRQLRVCELERYCSLSAEDLQESIDDSLSSPPAHEYKVRLANSILQREPVPAALGEVGHSVDVSGTGDPCSFSTKTYTVNWTYDASKDTVEFTMRHPTKKGKWWSAVGIGDTMADMDIGIVFLEDGRVKRMGDYFSSGYTTPDKDAHQDWTMRKSSIVKINKEGAAGDGSGSNEEEEEEGGDEDAEFHFARALTTEDTEKDRTLDGCVLFQFAANIGSYGSNFTIHKHEDWPDLYKACNIKTRCAHPPGVGESGDPPPTTLNTTISTNESRKAVGEIVKRQDVGAGLPPPPSAPVPAPLPGPLAIQVPSSQIASHTLPPPAQPQPQPESLEIHMSNGTNNDEGVTSINQISGWNSPNTNETEGVADTNAPNDSIIGVLNRALPSEVEPIEIEGNASTSLGTGTGWGNNTNVVSSQNITLEGAESTSPSPTPTPTTSTSASTSTAPETSTPILSTTTSTSPPPPPSSPPPPPPTTTTTPIETSSPSLAVSSQSGLHEELLPESGEGGRTPISGCHALKPDLDVCKDYFDNYFAQVKRWAEKHNEALEDQFGKACKLLNAVPHVPTLCCEIFSSECSTHL